MENHSGEGWIRVDSPQHTPSVGEVCPDLRLRAYSRRTVKDGDPRRKEPQRESLGRRPDPRFTVDCHAPNVESVR